MTPLVRLEGVHRRYRLRAETIHAVDDVSLTLRHGTIVGLVGPSGSGKTTLINLIVGWEQPDEGVVLRDASIGGDWSSLAVVPQTLGLIPELTLAENVGLPARLGNRQVRSPSDLMADIGLDGLAMRLPDEASLGEQQRTAVVRALVAAPAVLVADEPTSHQDEANALNVARMLRDAADTGSAVLIATHDERILAGVDEVIRIVDGRLVEAVA